MSGAEIRYYPNPRNEDEENKLRISNEKFLSLGLKPVFLDDGIMSEIFNVAKKYMDRCDKSKIICTSTWRAGMPVDFEGSLEPIRNEDKEHSEELNQFIQAVSK